VARLALKPWNYQKLGSAGCQQNRYPATFLRIILSLPLGKVNGADRLYLVIESVRPDTKHVRSFNAPAPADGAGGSGMG
jgi:hypothetical protein